MRSMGRCSYTWTEPGKEKDVPVRNQCPEKVWYGSKENCIFHDPSKKKDVELFMQKLQEKLDRKDYNFQGYQFLENLDFSKKKFEKDAYFEGASFQNAYFNKASFQDSYFNGASFQNAYFEGASFQNAHFEGASFQNASFDGATFQIANFHKATFQNAYFPNVIIDENLIFTPDKVGKLDLQNSQFRSKGTITVDLTNAKFYEAELEKVTFLDCNWPEKISEEKNGSRSFNELETIYRNLKQNMQHHGDYLEAGELYYREMEMKRKQIDPFTPKWWGQNILRILCGYGEKPSRVIAVSLLIVLLGAILFFYCGVSTIEVGKDSEGKPQITSRPIGYPSDSTAPDFLYCVYYSVVTFTTLGYGDIHPENCSYIFASLETFTGAFFMALFVLTFGRKMMR